MKNFILGIMVTIAIVMAVGFVSNNVTTVHQVKHNGEVIWQTEEKGL